MFNIHLGTTRKLRNGETDGVDYHFLSMEEFQKLDKAGDLLESGVFEGWLQYYIKSCFNGFRFFKLS